MIFVSENVYVMTLYDIPMFNYYFIGRNVAIGFVSWDKLALNI